MAKEKKNLNQIVTKTASQWRDRARRDRAGRKEITRAQKFALELLAYLDDNKMSQKELAALMDVSPQQVNKMLKAKANLTFETLDKVEEALEVHIPAPQIKSKRIYSQTFTDVLKVVYKSSLKQSEDDLTSTDILGTNPVLTPTLKNMEYYKPTAGQI